MLVVRGTKKLRDRLKAPLASGDESSTTVLGDWFATALFWRPQVAMFVNTRTLLPVFVPLAPAASLLERAPEVIAGILRRHGAGDAFVAAELESMREVRVAPTNDRSVLGVMNEFAFHGEFLSTRVSSLDALSMELSRLLLSPLRDSTGSPDRELAAILGSVAPTDTALAATEPTDTGPSNVIPFPGRRAVTPAPAGSVYQLKVTLKDTKPPIWRRVLVDGSTTLHQVHEVIQAAFGWWNYHLYEFEFGRTRYGIPDPDWDIGPPARNARSTPLDKVAKDGSSFMYVYDFGDYWQHRVQVEKVVPASAGMLVPTCIDGRRAGPPEDCGGPWGYEQLLEILADPAHHEHDERIQWLEGMKDGRFDPDAFDPAEFAQNMTMLRSATFDD